MRKESTMNYTENLEKICAECERIFDLTDEVDSQEWYYGHDCEGEI